MLNKAKSTLGNFKKVTLFLVFLMLLFNIIAPSLAFAEYTIPETPTSFGTATSLEKYIALIYDWSLGILTSLAIIVIIFAGYLFMTSTGNPDALARARNLLIAAISSVVLLVLAGYLISYLNPNIQVGLPGI